MKNETMRKDFEELFDAIEKIINKYGEVYCDNVDTCLSDFLPRKGGNISTDADDTIIALRGEWRI